MKQCFPQVGLLDREILFHLKVARECTEVSEVGCSYVINYEYILCTFRLGENTATNKHEIYATLRSLMDSCWVLVNYCWVLVDSYWVLVDSCWVLVDSQWTPIGFQWTLQWNRLCVSQFRTLILLYTNLNLLLALHSIQFVVEV